MNLVISRFMSKEEYDDIVRFIAQEKHMKNSEAFDSQDKFEVWHAGDDDDEEGSFLNWYTNEPMPYLPWASNRPYSASSTYNYVMSRVHMKTENNTKAELEKAEIFDYDNEVQAVPLCTVQSRSLRFKIRGLCSDFSFDRDYVYTIGEDGVEVYKGKTKSLLSYNRTTKLWHLFKPGDNSSLITSAAAEDSFMIGLNQIHFDQAREEKCYSGKLIQTVKFTSCTAGFFTCSDGRCIPMDKRCDQTAHCQDKSDENNCKLIIMENYNKNIAPFTVNQTNDEINAVNVNISAKIINILKINEVEQSFQVKIILLLTWYDYRLMYHNLKESRMENSPTLEEMAKLWIPKIVFDNTEHNDVMKMDDLAEVTISREGISTSADETIVDEVEIFKGSENKINFDKGFTKTVECIYQLQLYPFDTQECTVNLQVGEYKRKLIKLFPKSIQMKSTTLLTQFIITNWKLEYKNKGKNALN